MIKSEALDKLFNTNKKEPPPIIYARVLKAIKNELVKKGYDVEYTDIENLPTIIANAIPDN